MKHIGIVACSAEGAALCYRLICQQGIELLGNYQHPEITMHTPPLNEYMHYLNSNNWNGVGELMLRSSDLLANAGAEFAICPDNTIHNAFSVVKEKSKIPWLHIIEEVANEARKRDFNTLGILGTRFTMEGSVYTDVLSRYDLASIVPNQRQIHEIDRIIFDELVHGKVLQASQKYFISTIEDLRSRGVDAVILGCTEIPLIVNDEISPVPTLDSTRILANAALRYALHV